MKPLYFCAVCGGTVEDIFGMGWLHLVAPFTPHRVQLDIHRSNGYDGDMSTREVRAAELALAEAEREVAAARLKLERAKAASALPPEPRRKDATVRFKVQYRPGEKTYTYIALRTDAGWMLTGLRNSGKVLTWEEVVKVADRNYAGRPHFEDIT